MKLEIKPKHAIYVKGTFYRAGDEAALMAALDAPEELETFLAMCDGDIVSVIATEGDEPAGEGQAEAPGRAPAPTDGEGQAPADDGQRPRSRPARRRSPIEGDADV